MIPRAIFIVAICVIIGLARDAWVTQERGAVIDVLAAKGGGSVLVTDAEGKRVLIGAGGSIATLVALGKILPIAGPTIDLLIVQTSTKARVAAAQQILRRIAVKKILLGPWAVPLEEEGTEKGIPFERAKDTVIVLSGARLDLRTSADGEPSIAYIEGTRTSVFIAPDMTVTQVERLLRDKALPKASFLIADPARRTTEALKKAVGARAVLNPTESITVEI